MNVLAKFKITSCTSQREDGDIILGENGNPLVDENGLYQRKAASMATQVKLSAVQGEPFGKYTPSGAVDMYIRNPSAAQVFQDAWDAYVRSTDPKRSAPEFYVTFQIDDGTGWDA